MFARQVIILLLTTLVIIFYRLIRPRRILIHKYSQQELRLLGIKGSSVKINNSLIIPTLCCLQNMYCLNTHKQTQLDGGNNNFKQSKHTHSPPQHPLSFPILILVMKANFIIISEVSSPLLLNI